MGRKGLGCLILFALPFAAVGAGVTAWMGWTLVTYLKMQGWQEVPARIVRVDLEAHRGEDSDTHTVTAEYVYDFAGRRYTGRRVSLYSGSDNIGSFQRDVYRQLSECQKLEQPFRCYVDPDRPGGAILYRDLRWEMLAFQSIFALAFGGVGFGVVAGGMLGYRKARVDAKLAVAHPDEPWLQKPDWADGRAVSSSRTGLIVWLAAAAYWNLVAAPLYFVLPGEIVAKGNRYALIGLIFPAAGLGLIGGALAAVRRWRKFGQSVFQMAAVPGVIGGQLAGVIRVAGKVAPEDGFRLALSCVQKHASGSGKDRSISEKVLWQDDQIVGRDLLPSDPDHTAIPVLFTIPYKCRPTDETCPDDQTLWRLEARASVPGVDYRAMFDVPVFQTAESDPNYAPDPSATAEYAVAPDPERDLREAGVHKALSLGGDGFQFTFSMCRNVGFAVAIAAFAVVWTGVVMLLFYLKAPLFFPIAFGVFDVLILLAALDACFYRSVVEASPRGLKVTGGLFGLGRNRWIEAADVARIEPVQAAQSGQTLYYNIVVTCRNGKKLTAGKNVRMHRLAAAVAGQIQQALGKP